MIFCTYQSLAVVARAQDDGAPAFDIVLCDEAHRTTGVDHPGDAASPFVLVHDAERIRAAKRLYMAATPRLYTESARAKAARYDVDVFSSEGIDVPTLDAVLFISPRNSQVDVVQAVGRAMRKAEGKEYGCVPGSPWVISGRKPGNHLRNIDEFWRHTPDARRT